MVPGKQKQYQVKQDEVTDNDALLHKSVGLVIVFHYLKYANNPSYMRSQLTYYSL